MQIFEKGGSYSNSTKYCELLHVAHAKEIEEICSQPLNHVVAFSD